MYDGVMCFQADKISALKRHAIVGASTFAYSFTYDDGKEYCVLANSLFPFVSPATSAIDADTSYEMAKSAEVGVSLTIEQIKHGYAPNTYAMSSLIVFNEKVLLLWHSGNFVSALNDEMSRKLLFCFYGDESFAFETMNTYLHLRGLVSANGQFSFLEYASVEEKLAKSQFKFATRLEVYGADIDNPEELDLFVDGSEYQRGIVKYDCYTNGILYFANGSFYFIEYATNSSIYSNAFEVNLVGSSFEHFGDLYVRVDNCYLRFACENVQQDGHNWTIDFPDFQMEFVFLNANTVVTRVIGYEQYDKDGKRIRWEGDLLSNAEIVAAGLDSDTQSDPEAQKKAESLVNLQETQKLHDRQKMQEDFQTRQAADLTSDYNAEIAARMNPGKSGTAIGIQIWTDEPPYNLTKIMRDDEIEQLYKLF